MAAGSQLPVRYDIENDCNGEAGVIQEGMTESDECEEEYKSSSVKKTMSEEDLGDSSLDESKCEIVDEVTLLNPKKIKSMGKENTLNTEETEKKHNITLLKHLIIIRGIPVEALKDKKLMITIFGEYGEIKRTYIKKSEPDSLYLLVINRPWEMLHKLKANVDNLKLKLGTDNLTFQNDAKISENMGIGNYLSEQAKELLSNCAELRHAVHQLMQEYDAQVFWTYSQIRIKNLISTVTSFAASIYDRRVPMRVHVFGSRVTGLATEDSDVDLYLQIGNSFRGSFHNWSRLQEELVVLFASKMRLYPQEFQNVTPIPLARVPIVRFTHVKYNLNCDLSFKSGLSTMNSILVRTYLELDERVKFLICAVKLWMRKNDLADRNLFTTYAQIWMVLFFLMQAEIEVIPTVLSLRRMLPLDQQEFIVEGWNCSFPDITNIVWRSASTLTEEVLLLRFFEFYSNVNLSNYVLCTLTGIKVEKKHFLKFYDNLPPIFIHYKFKVKRNMILLKKLIDDFSGLCVQDPFDHCHNITKTMNFVKFHCFAKLCENTADILRSWND